MGASTVRKWFLLALLAALGCASGTGGTGAGTDAGGTAAGLTFVPDPGIRVDYAATAKTGISDAGVVYIYYGVSPGGPMRRTTAADGLSFDAGIAYTTYEHHPGRVLMKDGKWRRYSLSPSYVFSSSVSTDGVTFVAEDGGRYSPATVDNGTMGVYDHFTDPDGGVVMLYLGDLFGKNNARRAYSTDNGVTFAYQNRNVLGDDDAGGGANTYVDISTIPLPDGGRRLFAMKGGTGIYSFVTFDYGATFTQETSARVRSTDWTEFTVIGLYDPTVVRLLDGRYRMYVTANIQQDGGTHEALVSATSAP